MTCYESKHLFLSAVVVAAFFFCAGAFTASYFSGQEEPVPEPEVVEEPPYEPEPWKGRMECRHGGLTLYTADNLVEYIVSAQPSGWMWEMFKEDGTVVLFHQPERVFCSAIPEE